MQIGKIRSREMGINSKYIFIYFFIYLLICLCKRGTDMEQQKNWIKKWPTRVVASGRVEKGKGKREESVLPESSRVVFSKDLSQEFRFRNR